VKNRGKMVGVYMVLHGLNIKKWGFHGDFVVISGVFTVTNLGVHHKKVRFFSAAGCGWRG
jgi:hypothetical protein